MKLRMLWALGGTCGAMMISAAMGEPYLTPVSHSTSGPFLTAHHLQSSVVGITGFALGEKLLGLIGTAANPWSITTAGGFFNLGSGSNGFGVFNGEGQTAATNSAAPWSRGAMFDSGVTLNATTDALGMIKNEGASNPIGFAQFSQGNTSGSGADVVWMTSNPNGLVVGQTTNLFRLTWSFYDSARLRMRAVVKTGGGTIYEVPLALDFVWIPAPGALALFGLVGVFGGRRRRG